MFGAELNRAITSSARTNDINARGVIDCDTGVTVSVRIGRRQGQARKKIRIGVGSAITVENGVIERGKELEPTLYAGVVVAHLDGALQSLVIRVNQCRPKGIPAGVLLPTRYFQPPS